MTRWSATTAVALPQLATIGIAGAWRLGRWDLLKRYLGTAAACQEVLSSDEVWEMRIGKLLSSISSRYAVPPRLDHVESVCVLGTLHNPGIDNHTLAHQPVLLEEIFSEVSRKQWKCTEGCMKLTEEMQSQAQRYSPASNHRLRSLPLRSAGQTPRDDAATKRKVGGCDCRERVQTAVGLDEDRKAIMAPLSAASIESYTRAYPYLVKLHMLQELADAAFLLQEGSVAGEKDRQRRLKWEERLQVTQSSLAVQVSAAWPAFLALPRAACADLTLGLEC